MKTLITDLGKIARFSEINRKTNFDFRAKLKWKANNEKKLDNLVHSLYKDIASQVDCQACGNCCKTYLLFRQL